MPRAHGLLITFEGGEGAGKTTQINRLAAWLVGQGEAVVTTREPGGTPEGDSIRNLFVNTEGGNWSPEAEVLLLFAGRAIHVRDLIAPALAAGKIVLCDRFTDSTRVYQCAGRGLDRDAVERVKHFAIGDMEPDLTLIFDLPVETGLGRAKSRIARTVQQARDGTGAEDRFEQADLAFHERLRQGYLALAQENPSRYRIINADQDMDTVTAHLQAQLQNFLQERPA